MDKETIMETLTLDRIQQDLKKKRNTYCIYTVGTVAFILFYAFLIKEYMRLTNYDGWFSGYGFGLSEQAKEIEGVIESLVILSAISMYAILGFVRMIRLSLPVRNGTFVIWSDMIRKKARPAWIIFFCPIYFLLGCYWLTFYRHGRFVCGRMLKMHWWSDLFSCRFASLVKNASPGDTYYLVSLDGKKIDMIYNANWFTLSDEVAQLVTLSESETPSQDRLPQGAE